MSDFFNKLDAIVSGEPVSKKGKLHIKRSAKEELDNNSSQEEFMNMFADFVASFIRDNRNAFDLDDTAAVSEFAQVAQLEEIQSRIVSSLQQPEEEEDLSLDGEENEEDNIPLEDTDDNEANDDLVSEDVMAMLDEDEEKK